MLSYVDLEMAPLLLRMLVQNKKDLLLDLSDIGYHIHLWITLSPNQGKNGSRYQVLNGYVKYVRLLDVKISF